MTAPTIDRIAQQMRAERNRLGLSLTEAAHRVHLEAVVLGSYERGDRFPPLPKLRQWVEALNHKLLAVPTRNGAEGSMRIEYGVAFGDELMPCDSEEQAVKLAGRMAGAVLVSRVVRTTGWEPAR